MFEQIFKNIDDVLWKESGCSSELDYTEQTSWLLFLKYLDDLEQERALAAELKGQEYSFILAEEHRWSSWAAPKKADKTADLDAAKALRRDLLESCNLHTVLDCPGGTFLGAGVKTELCSSSSF